MSAKTQKGLKRARSQRLNILYKYYIWRHEEFVRECIIYVTTHARTFSVLNSDPYAVNSLQKLKTFIKCIQVKLPRLLNDDETEEFNQI